MRLTYIANVRMPTEKAHGLQIIKMCRSLAVAGNKVELVVPRRFNKIKQSPFEYYDIDRCFKLTKLPCLDLIPLDKYIGHLGMWVETVTFNFFLFFELLLGKARKADIVYVRDWSLLPCVFLTRNLVFEVHKFPKKYFLYSPYLKRVKKIIVVTRKLKELFQERGILFDKILTAPDAVDLNIFDVKMSKAVARKNLNLPPQKRIIGYFGRFTTMGMEKGVSDILKALPLLGVDVVFLGAGGSSGDISHYRLEAGKLNLQDKIIFLERVPQKILAQYQKACDVLLMPFPNKPHYAYYMSPAKMFEHMAAKRPIVTTDLPSIREVLSEKSAVFVKPDDPEDLAEGIKRLLGDEKMAEQISAKAFEDVQEYTWEKRVNKIINFIRGDICP